MLSESRRLIWCARIVLFGLPGLVAVAGAVAHRWHIYAALPWVALSWLIALPWLARAVRRQRDRAQHERADRGDKEGTNP